MAQESRSRSPPQKKIRPFRSKSHTACHAIFERRPKLASPGQGDKNAGKNQPQPASARQRSSKVPRERSERTSLPVAWLLIDHVII